MIIRWDRIAELPAILKIVEEEHTSKTYGVAAVAHIPDNKHHTEQLLAQNESGIYRRQRLASTNTRIKWSRPEFVEGGKLSTYIEAESTRQVLLNALDKSAAEGQVRYCPHCDGWNPDCPHNVRHSTF